MAQLLLPKATAVWLVQNTTLTFEQIAEFCGLHVLEVKGIADGDVAHGIKGMDPISSGQLSREEIADAEHDPKHRLKLLEPKVEVPEVKTKLYRQLQEYLVDVKPEELTPKAYHVLEKKAVRFSPAITLVRVVAFGFGLVVLYWGAARLSWNHLLNDLRSLVEQVLGMA